MIAAFTVALLLTATPAPPKIAAPGLDGLNLEEKELEFYSEHFATQFTFEGVKVTTASQVRAVIGLERQKQVLGCSEDGGCMTELANALGVDGILTGTIAKIEDVYQLNLKIVSADDASNLATYSTQVTGQKKLVNELSKAATVMAKLMKEKLAARAQRAAEVARAEAQKAEAARRAEEARAAEEARRAQAEAEAARKARAASQSSTVASSSSGSTTASATSASSTDATIEKRATESPEPPHIARKNRLTIGPSLVFFGTLPIEYERALGDRVSIAVGALAYYPSLLALFGVTSFGGAGTLDLRFFLTKSPAPEGLWLGPELLGEYALTGSTATGTTELARVAVNAVAGYTFIADNGLTVSGGAGIGGSYLFATRTYNPGVGLSLALHLNAGYAF